jgi:hypothetical protein
VSKVLPLENAAQVSTFLEAFMIPIGERVASAIKKL